LTQCLFTSRKVQKPSLDKYKYYYKNENFPRRNGNEKLALGNTWRKGTSTCCVSYNQIVGPHLEDNSVDHYCPRNLCHPKKDALCTTGMNVIHLKIIIRIVLKVVLLYDCITLIQCGACYCLPVCYVNITRLKYRKLPPFSMSFSRCEILSVILR